METTTCEAPKAPGIDNLPEEVLEYILSKISPYQDLHDCMLVCKKWRRCVRNVTKTKRRDFQRAINEFDIKWSRSTPEENSPTISRRYSHTAVVSENSMFVFGGCTCAMTTFNDLWKLDLTTRNWVRPLTMGAYPSPKACSSLIKYKDFLVLFGGWTYPPSYPLYQSWHLFNELHVYDVTANNWTCIISTEIRPPPVAGHSVSVVGDYMIIFGGLQKPSSAVHCEKSNDIWKLHLDSWSWCKQEVQAGPKPSGRFGQTQVILDEKNLLVLGGSGGPCSQFCDCWVLNMEGPLWKWIKVEIAGKNNEPANIWSNPGVKIGDKIVVLNRIRDTEESPIVYYPRSQWNTSAPEDGRLSRIDLANRRPDLDENVNGRRGFLNKVSSPRRDGHDEDPAVPGPSGLNCLRIPHSPSQAPPPMAAFHTPPLLSPPQRNLKREKRLGKLQNMEEKLLKKTAPKKEKRTYYLGMYVLDISKVLDRKNPVATWLPPKNVKNGPEESILYTLVEGKGELVMFGGILKDANSLAPCNLSSQISNSLHFVSANDYVI
ncbi:F-box only protein 42-like [Anthonomus grandis grandis]|uniref:F-box only protein 42-like n=1 Tax=Anthonomus grandis grandis TaxID=2921223 RepID=UPI002166BB2E|nr:F-box only protein 42-like [Anthonomus grandis grandis]